MSIAKNNGKRDQQTRIACIKWEKSMRYGSDDIKLQYFICIEIPSCSMVNTKECTMNSLTKSDFLNLSQFHFRNDQHLDLIGRQILLVAYLIFLRIDSQHI